MLRVVQGGGGPAQERSSASLRSVAVVWAGAGFGRLGWSGVFEEAGYGLVEGRLGGCGCVGWGWGWFGCGVGVW